MSDPVVVSTNQNQPQSYSQTVSPTATLNETNNNNNYNSEKSGTSQQDFQLKVRPWRRHVTPWSHIVNHRYEGEGTEDKPYIVDWISSNDAAKEGEPNGDPENPMTWAESYKWFVTMSVAIATLAVAMASSTL